MNKSNEKIDGEQDANNAFLNEAMTGSPTKAKRPGAIDTEYFIALQTVRSAEKSDSGVLFAVDDALLRVDVLAADVVRLKITRTGEFDETPTYAVCADLSAWSASFELLETSDKYTIKTSALSVVVHKSPFAIDAYRAYGDSIFESSSTDSHSSGAYLYLNDEFIVSRKCHKEDAIYGLGEKTGRLNRKGRGFTLWNTDVLNPDASGRFTASLEKDDPRRDSTSTEFDPYYISIPFFHHLKASTSAAAGFFIDNGYLSNFDFTDPTEYRFRFAGGQYTEYIFAGPTLRNIIGRYTELTGRIDVPPIWALGYHQCRWFHYSQDDMEKMAVSFRAKALPCDALWLDINHMEGYRVFTWDDKDFPNASKLFRRLSDNKLRAISIVDPGVKAEPGYDVYDSGAKRDIFCKTLGGHTYIGQVWPGRTAFPDFTLPEARDWWGDLNAGHVKSGFAGIWNDMNEPATGDIPEGAMRFTRGKYPHERYHNQYGLLMAMSTRDGLLGAEPQNRTFILSRAGFAGIQRYAANWMGDNMARWDHLWMSMPMAMGLGLSGQPFVGADIGGFAEDTNAELFVRWIQCGVLTPFCRNHNNWGCVDQYPWSFGKTVLDMTRSSLRLRYRLMPYIYSAFVDAAETGLPIQSPLALDYQDDPSAREVEDQYLFGDSIMVAPVYAAGATMRRVYLPQGGWHNWSTGERIVGPRYINESVPMESIPVFVKEGAVIPTWPEAPLSTMDYHPSSIELHVYTPDTDGATVSTLTEDDGITFAHKEGRCYKTVFTLTRDSNRLTLDASTSGSGYPEFAREEFVIVFHGATPAAVTVNGASIPVQAGRVTLPNTGQSFKLDASFGSDSSRSALSGNGLHGPLVKG